MTTSLLISVQQLFNVNVGGCTDGRSVAKLGIEIDHKYDALHPITRKGDSFQ